MEGFFMMAAFLREGPRGVRSSTSDSLNHLVLSISFFLEDHVLNSNFFLDDHALHSILFLEDITSASIFFKGPSSLGRVFQILIS